MKKEPRKEKPDSMDNAPRKQNYTELWDEAYRQINRDSFQQNFKVLIGHYKDIGQIPQVG